MYEFPDGYNDAFGIERFRAPEVMFDPSIWADVPTVVGSSLRLIALRSRPVHGCGVLTGISLLVA